MVFSNDARSALLLAAAISSMPGRNRSHVLGMRAQVLAQLGANARPPG